MNFARKQIVLLVAAIVIVVGCLAYAGVLTLSRIIYNQKGCGFANIDNIELHTQTDIPSVSRCECEFLQTTNTKQSVFYLDMNRDELAGYIQKNKFVAFDISANEVFPFARSIASIKGTVYVKHGHTADADYRLVLDTEAKKIYVELRYTS